MLKLQLPSLVARASRPCLLSLLHQVSAARMLLLTAALLTFTLSIACESKPAPRPAAAFDPSIRGGTNGLEVRWWLTGDTNARVAAVLAPYAANPVPMTPAQTERWNLNGLRMVRAPLADLPALQSQLPPIAAIQSTWLGWAREWIEAMRGRRVRPDRALLIDANPRELPAGSLRFLARAWSAPSASGPVLRIELATQLLEQAKLDIQSDPYASPVILPAEQEGEVFRGLTLAAALEPGFVYIITAEKPGIVWGEETDQPEESPAAEPSFGPEVAGPLTLGQAMLSATAADTGSAPAKALVVLVPRVPDLRK